VIKWRDDHVGCIYFDETAFRNHVEYFQTDFPPKTVPPVERQILDVSNSKWASPGMARRAQDANTIVEVEQVIPKPKLPPLKRAAKLPRPIPVVTGRKKLSESVKRRVKRTIAKRTSRSNRGRQRTG
jgi:hypothetical protein